MQVRIGKRDEGKADIVVVHGRRSGKAPVMVRGVKVGGVRKAVRALLGAPDRDPVPPAPGT